MKPMIILGLLLFNTLSFASRDSVAFFYRAEKVSVLINELTPYGRLGSLMDLFTQTENFKWEDEGFKMSSSRHYRGAGCRFHFTPFDEQENILIENRSLYAEFDLPIFEDKEEVITEEFYFESSANDKFRITLTNDKIIFEGSKILRNH